MRRWIGVLALALAVTFGAGRATAAEVVTLDGVTLDSEALDNGCSTETATASAEDPQDCRYRVCFSLLKSLWLLDEASRRKLEPDAEAMEEQQREFEKSHVGEELAFTVLPRLKFQRQAIQLYRDRRAEDPNYSFASLWADVSTSATQLEIPERALRALVSAYGEDEQRFLEFQKMFPDDHETAMARSRNSWEREARRVALEKEISPEDNLTSGELEKARVEWMREMESAPEAMDAMLRERKRQYHVNAYLLNQVKTKAKFADPSFKEGLVQWIEAKIIDPDKAVFGRD